MNICMVSRDFLPNIGGIASHVYELSKALVRLGHNVHVLQPGYGTKHSVKLEVLDGIKVHRLFSSGRVRGWRFIVLLRRTRQYWKELLLRERIDILHWHVMISGSFETKVMIAAIPKIFTNHSSGYLEMVEKVWGRWYLRWLLRHAGRVIAPSEELAAKSSWTGYPAHQVYYIPNGVDCDKFRPNLDGVQARADLNIDKDSLFILCPRRLQPKNGVIYMVEAMPYIKDSVENNTKLVIAGGNYHEERLRIEDRITRNGTKLDIIFLGNVPNEHMPTLYAAADIVVLPSLMEAVSISGLEALASGKPLVGTRVGGLPAIIDDGVTGLLVPPRDSRALANAIVSLNNDPDKRHRMGASGRAKVEHEFIWTVIANRTLEVYQTVLKGKE